MIEEVESLLDEYWIWLRDGTSLREIGDWTEITIPYLDRHNDCLQIYAKRVNGKFVLTDDGYVLDDLEMSGCNINTPNRQELLKTILNGFGVHQNDKSLEVRVSSGNFALCKHNLVQAMLAVNDLFYLTSPVVANPFEEDVKAWFNLTGISYTPNVKLTGKTGYDHRFEFVIPKSKVAPERLIRTISRPSRAAAQSTAFSCIDIKEMRSLDTHFYAILNDIDSGVSNSVVKAMQSYGIRAKMWSERACVVEELAA